MAYLNKCGQNDDYRREELIRIIEHSVEKLTLQELEALYYDMSVNSATNQIYCRIYIKFKHFFYEKWTVQPVQVPFSYKIGNKPQLLPILYPCERKI